MASEKTILPLTRDENRVPIPLVPDTDALAVTVDDSIATATDITLNANTTLIEVHAVDGGIFVRRAATASSSDFDYYVQSGQTRHFPVKSVTTLSVIQDDSGAKVRLIEY
jgi:hypothetical protein